MKICIVQIGCLNEYRAVNETSAELVNLSKSKAKSWLELSIKNHKNYCDKHKYEYIFKEYDSLPTERNICWYKIKAILETMQDESIDWVFYCDLDTLIMNDSFALEDIINLAEASGKDLIVPKQVSSVMKDPAGEGMLKSDEGINFGQFFIKNCKWAKIFLQKLWDFPIDNPHHIDLLNSKYYDNCVANIFWRLNIFETKNNSLAVYNSRFNSYYDNEGDQTLDYSWDKRQQTYYKNGQFKIHFAVLNFEERQKIMPEFYEKSKGN